MLTTIPDSVAVPFPGVVSGAMSTLGHDQAVFRRAPWCHPVTMPAVNAPRARSLATNSSGCNGGGWQYPQCIALTGTTVPTSRLRGANGTGPIRSSWPTMRSLPPTLGLGPRALPNNLFLQLSFSFPDLRIGEVSEAIGLSGYELHFVMESFGGAVVSGETPHGGDFGRPRQAFHREKPSPEFS